MLLNPARMLMHAINECTDLFIGEMVDFFFLPAANVITVKPNQLSVLWGISGLPDKRQKKIDLN